MPKQIPLPGTTAHKRWEKVLTLWNQDLPIAEIAERTSYTTGTIRLIASMMNCRRSKKPMRILLTRREAGELEIAAIERNMRSSELVQLILHKAVALNLIDAILKGKPIPCA